MVKIHNICVVGQNRKECPVSMVCLGPARPRLAINFYLGHGCAYLAHAWPKLTTPSVARPSVARSWPKFATPRVGCVSLGQAWTKHAMPRVAVQTWPTLLPGMQSQRLALQAWPKRGSSMHSQGLAQKSWPKHPPSKQCHAWLCTLGPRDCQVCTARQKKLNCLPGCAYLAQAWPKYAQPRVGSAI